MFMITLLSALACGFDTILQEVDKEAARLTDIGQKKSFKMGDANLEMAHLHTGGPDCPMNFDVELEATEWRKLAFRAIKAQIHGIRDDQLTLEGTLARLEFRQRVWHSELDSQSIERHADDPQCTQLTRTIWKSLEDMPS